jgi:hypothetical protein
LTGDFLDLEREIDSFAMQLRVETVNATVPRREGLHAHLDEQLALIETMATALREKAVERFSGSLPVPPRRDGGPVTGRSAHEP